MKSSFLIAAFFILAVAVFLAATGVRQTPVMMDNARLQVLIKRIDANVEGEPGRWLFDYEGIKVRIYTDENADRMRIMAGITSVENIDADVMQRVLQANFDSALDARYAIAQDALWSVFLHPLSSLGEKEFFSGLGQAVTLVATFGTTYTSGLFVFQGGDSQQEHQRYYTDIMEKGLSI